MASTDTPHKRKIPSSSSQSSRKKAKTQHRTADALPWKTVSRPVDAGLDGDDGILELEEVDDVEVVYEETEAGRVVKFNVIQNKDNSEDDDGDADSGPEIIQDDNDKENTPMEPRAEDESFDAINLLPNWHSYSLHPQLLRALHAKDFLSPTPIQAAAIPFAIAGRDVVGVAQTGSGKTLAYGLPILHYLLAQPRPPTKTKRQLRALILAPTRELALQVSSHLNACLNTFTEAAVENDSKAITKTGTKSKSKGNKKKAAALPAKAPPAVSVAAIVGGMSSQKQRRILDRGVDVLVATPGRLWDIIQDDESLAKQIKNLKFLVLDEADRMIEAGHFAELENILRLTLRESRDDQIEPTEEEDEEEDTKDGIKDALHLQTFVFSATLSKDLQRNVKKRTRPKGVGKYKRNDKPASTLDDLLLRLDFRDPEPEVIDISPTGGVVESLKESKIECLSSDKDVYLYYFLLRYPGRSLVFLSSIDGIRRLMPLTELLGLKAYPLHSQLEQRQRLKNLDRFKTTPNSILLATDIAARGLDIPAVDHVIHYQIPRSADAYVHRNGRTARAMMKGFSMLMCAPDERRVVRALLGGLGRQDTEIPEMTVELNLLDKLKTRVTIARKIEMTQHKIKKQNHDRNWMKETAEAMEIELDSDYASDASEQNLSKQKRKAQNAKNAGLKADLKRLLSQPLIARGVSTRYITSGSRPIVDDLIAGQYNETMLGLKKAEAGNDLVDVKKSKKLGKKPKVEEKNEDEDEEEWGGIDLEAMKE